jgi:hypothetical protein
MLTVEGSEIRIDTRTQKAVFTDGVLTSLVRKSDGRVLITAGAGMAPLELVYGSSDISALSGTPGDKATTLRINDLQAQVRLAAWNGDGILAISEDPPTGDIVVEPSGFASRPGLRAVRWNLSGIEKGLKLVAPLYQGVNLKLEDSLIQGNTFNWPHSWDAGFAILQGADGGMWIHCRDTEFRYKRLTVGVKDDPRRLSFDTEAYGPLGRSLSAGSLAWRINVYSGDWKVPAATYRDWLWDAYRLGGQTRPDWVEGVRFAVSWCPCDVTVLDALKARIDAGKVLLHVSHWRSDPYDQNYPTYTPSEQGAAFVKCAREMGFRAMPHFNSIDMDPSHPSYTYLRDFVYRDIERKRAQGWTWVDGHVLPLPESNESILHHRDKNTMIKIHPGHSMWRSILAENVAGAARSLGLEVAFLDVTLNTWNIDNCLVENTTPTEGMKRLTALIANIDKGLAVGGEGRNEITMQDQSFGQVHLFESWQENCPGLERTGGCALNEFVFGKLCKSFGYTSLSGKTPEQELRMKLHVEHGAIPTVTVRSGEDIAKPNKAVREMLEMAKG